MFPFPWSDLSHGFSGGYAGRGEAVQDGVTDVELGNLTVEVPSGQTLAQHFHTLHLGFDAASAVIAGPSLPDRPAEAFGCAQGLVTRDRSGSVRLPRFTVFPSRYDCRWAAGDNCVVTLPGVEGTVGGDAGDLLIRRDLVEQLGQHGRVAHIVCVELGSSNF